MPDIESDHELDDWSDAHLSALELEDEHLHQASQEEKSHLVFGLMNQRAFYKALEKNPEIQILNKFNQSGITGFLPITDPGVCMFMSKDFARAVTEGRFTTWQEKIATKDAQMIERLRAGQHNKHTDDFERSLRGSPVSSPSNSSSDSSTHQNHLLKRDATSQFISESFEGYSTKSSCMVSPCIMLNVSLERKGFFGATSVMAKSFGHSMMITMATTKDGKLDPEHLLFMDPNAGIFKIKNHPETIKQLMVAIDKQLLSDFNVTEFRATPLTKSWLPLSGTSEWEHQETLVLSGAFPDHPNNYALSEVCLIDEYLRTQITRLEGQINDKMNSIQKVLFKGSDDKLNALKECREDLINHLRSYSQATPKQHAEFQKQLLSKIDNAVSEKRFKFGVLENTSKTNFNLLKERIEKIKKQSPPSKDSDQEGDGRDLNL